MATLTEKAVIDLVINGRQSETTMKQITNATNNARKALYQLAETDPGYAKQKKQLEELMNAQSARIVKINQEKTAWEKFKAGGMGMIGNIAGGNLVATGIQKLLELGPAVIDHQMKLRDSFADIAKAADMSDKEVADLNAQLKGLDTRTATEDLRNMAVVGGQFGIAKAEMAGFVESADKLNVALGDQFESVEKVAETALTLRNTFQDIKSDRIDEDMMKIGNGLNYLEAQGAATAPVMADFSSRIGGVAIPLGLTSGQVLGLSATLQELNVTAERGSSAMVDILSGITKAPDTFAKYARGVDGATLSSKQFKDLVNSDLNAAFMAVIRGFKEGDTSATGMAAKLADMDIKGNGVMEIFMKLASNTELLTTRQQQSAEALTNTSSVTAEFNKKNHELAVNLKKLGEWFDGFLENGALGKFASGIVSLTVKLLGLSSASSQVAKGYVDQRDKAQQLSDKMDPLIKRHEELSKKSKLSQIEQEELKKLTTQIAAAMPAAVTQFDQYANAIGVSTKKAHELIDAQREMAKQMKQSAMEEQKLQLRSIEYQRQEIIKKIKSRESVTVDRNGNTTAMPLSAADVQQLQGELAKLQTQTFETIRTMRDLDGQQSIADRRKARRAAEPKPTPKVDPNAGTAETEAERKAREKAEKAKEKADKAAQRQATKETNQAQRHEDELARLMADARARTADAADREHEKELLQFGEKYHKMYELAGNNKTKQEEITSLMYLELAALEQKDHDRQFKEAKKHSDEMLKIGLKELKDQEKIALAKVKGRVAAGGLTKEQGKAAELEVEQAFFLAKEVLLDTHYKALLQKAEGNEKLVTEVKAAQAEAQEGIDAQKTENEAGHAQARTDIRLAELEHDEEVHRRRMEMARAEKEFRQQMLGELSSMLMNDWTQTLKNYKDFWQQASVLQKVAFLATKAYALAEIGIQLSKQLSLVNTAAAVVDAATFGIGGTAVRVKGYALAIGSAALQTARVMAISPSVPAFAAGGYTDEDPGGFTQGPTYYSKRNIIAGEKGREWIMSGPMLQNPVMANLAGALQALQVTGAYKQLSFNNSSSTGSSGGSSASGSASNDALLMLLVQEQQQTRAALEAYAKRPIVNNYRLTEEFAEDIQQIRQSNSL